MVPSSTAVYGQALHIDEGTGGEISDTLNQGEVPGALGEVPAGAGDGVSIPEHLGNGAPTEAEKETGNEQNPQEGAGQGQSPVNEGSDGSLSDEGNPCLLYTSRCV